MQEEVDEKTMALIVNSSKMTAQTLKGVLAKFVSSMDEKNRIRESELRTEKRERKAREEQKRGSQKEARKAEKAEQAASRPGRMSLKEMTRSGSQLSNIEITDKNIKSFEKVARKYGIQYSLKKDRSSEKPRYIVFFRAKDVDVMTAAFKEYTGATLPKSRKASIRKRLKSAIERSVKHREREKVRTKERQPQL